MRSQQQNGGRKKEPLNLKTDHYKLSNLSNRTTKKVKENKQSFWNYRTTSKCLAYKLSECQNEEKIVQKKNVCRDINQKLPKFDKR